MKGEKSMEQETTYKVGDYSFNNKRLAELCEPIILGHPELEFDISDDGTYVSCEFGVFTNIIRMISIDSSGISFLDYDDDIELTTGSIIDWSNKFGISLEYSRGIQTFELEKPSGDGLKDFNKILEFVKYKYSYLF